MGRFSATYILEDGHQEDSEDFVLFNGNQNIQRRDNRRLNK